MGEGRPHRRAVRRQARPETVHARAGSQQVEHYRLVESGRVLGSGRSVGSKTAAGPVRVIPSAADLRSFQAGEVLVTDKTDPAWEPIMKKAAAILTNRGGRTCRAGIVSRELGGAAVVGTERGTAALSTGQAVTVSCAEGDTSFVYDVFSGSRSTGPVRPRRFQPARGS
jgi:pyruvate,water dikinase